MLTHKLVRIYESRILHRPAFAYVFQNTWKSEPLETTRKKKQSTKKTTIKKHAIRVSTFNGKKF